MNQQLILQPVMAMFLLTGLVWALMYARRIRYTLVNHIDPQSLATPEFLNARIPVAINNPSNNLKNLFELPVIFYALCAFLLLTHRVDQAYLTCAWAFVALRFVHSVIHCTINIVNLRFAAYFLSSIALWVMVVRMAAGLF
jgi:hypothetical protein